MEDLYSVLGVSKTASSDEIKRAYRVLAMKYHPDRNPGDTVAEEKFKSISSAYSILGDEQKRREYDMRSDYSYTTSQSSYNNSGTGSYYDPFAQWANNSDSYNTQFHRTYYTYTTSSDHNTNSNITKAEYFAMLIQKAIILMLCMFFFRFSFLFLPVGPLLCLFGFVKSITGISEALRGLLAPTKTK